jgi:hypothetical protein
MATMNTTKTLRDELFKVMTALKEGTVTPSEASALSRVASQIIRTTRTEIQMERLNLQYRRSIPANGLNQLKPVRM